MAKGAGGSGKKVRGRAVLRARAAVSFGGGNAETTSTGAGTWRPTAQARLAGTVPPVRRGPAGLRAVGATTLRGLVGDPLVTGRLEGWSEAGLAAAGAVVTPRVGVLALAAAATGTAGGTVAGVSTRTGTLGARAVGRLQVTTDQETTRSGPARLRTPARTALAGWAAATTAGTLALRGTGRLRLAAGAQHGQPAETRRQTSEGTTPQHTDAELLEVG